MDEPVKTRRYRSERRREQAAETRRAVLRAAYKLFTGEGYAKTAVTAIAQRAGVSLDTVYASVGRKPQLLLAVHDMILGEADSPIPAEQRRYVQLIRAAPGARAKIKAYAEALGRLLPQTVPLAEALRVAALTDVECRRVWESLQERRAANMRLFAADLRSTGELRGDLTDGDVADLVWSHNSPEFFQLVASRGWSPARYSELVADLWIRMFLE